jgi:PAS domain S-box-containing protein
MKALSVLVVDERPLELAKIAALLREHDFTVDTASTYTEALERVAEPRAFDVAVVDQLSPLPPPGLTERRARHERRSDVSGQLVSALRTQSPETAVVLLSHRETAEGHPAVQVQDCIELDNPVAEQQLPRILREAAGRRTTRVTRGQGVRSTQDVVAALEVAAALGRSIEPEPALPAVCQAAVPLLEAAHCALVLLSPDAQSGQVIAEYPARGWEGVTIPAERLSQADTAVRVSRTPVTVRRIRPEQWPVPLDQDLRDAGVSSMLLCPILSADQLFGYLLFSMGDPERTFDSQDEALGQALAGIVGGTIVSTRRHAESIARVEQLEALRQTTLTLTELIDRQALLRSIIQQAVKLLKAEGGGIYEYNADLGELKIVADFQRPAHLGKTLKIGQGMAGRLVQEHAPFCIVDDYSAWADRPRVFEDGSFGAVIEVPLMWQQEIIGVLYVDDQVGRKFTTDDVMRLRLFAEQAAIPLVNVDRIKLPSGATGLDVTRASTDIFKSIGFTTLDERLTLIAKHATAILHAESCGVQLVKRPGVLTLEASYGHREGGFKKGQEFLIRSGPHTGLAGHIAYQRELFNAHGDALINHPATRSPESGHLPSRRCYSLLALPLSNPSNGKLIAVLRIENKKGPDGRPSPDVGFTQDDEERLLVFGESVVVAIQFAEQAQELRERKELLERLVANSPHGIIAADKKGLVTLMNERAEEILGFEHREGVHMDVRRLYDDPFEPSRVRRLLENAGTSRVADHEAQVRTKAGQTIPIKLSAALLRDDSGHVEGSVGYFEDLREAKEMDRRFKFLVDASELVARSDRMSQGLQELAEMIGALLGGTSCRILLLSARARILRPGAVWRADVVGVPPAATHARDTRLLVSERLILDAALSDDRAVMTFDQTTDARRQSLAGVVRELGLQDDVESLLLIPLKIASRPVGLLEIGRTRGSGETVFTAGQIALAGAVASQTAALIDRLQLHELDERRNSLLSKLYGTLSDLHLERDPTELQREIVSQAVELLGYSAGFLFANHPRTAETVLAASYPLRHDLIGQRDPHDQGIAGLVVLTGLSQIITNDLDPAAAELKGLRFDTLIGVPLRRPSGQVDLILVVAADASLARFVKVDREILERFATRAASLLNTSRLWNWEKRDFEQLAAMRRLEEYMLGTPDLEKVLAALLTGATAEYCLRFNRAMVLLLDDGHEALVGRLGVGHLTGQETRHNWYMHHRPEKNPHGVDHYLEQLDAHGHTLTPVDERIREVRIPLGSQGLAEPFRDAVRDQFAILESADRLAQLPAVLVDAIGLTVPLAIVPIVGLERLLGFVLVDNVATLQQIFADEVDRLLNLANTAGTALVNRGLLTDTVTRSQIDPAEPGRALFGDEAARRGTPPELARVRVQVAQSAQAVLHADSAVLWSLDHDGTFRLDHWAGMSAEHRQEFQRHPPQAEQTADTVLQRGWVEVCDVADAGRDPFVPPSTRELLLRVGVRSFRGVALTIGAEKLGVLYLNYREPRPQGFSAAEREAALVFANHAALVLKRGLMFDELRRARETAARLAEMMIVGGLDRTLRSVVKGTREVLRSDAVTLYVYDQRRKRLSRPVVDGLDFPHLARRDAEERKGSIVWTVLNSPKPKVIEHAATDPLIAGRRFQRQERIASCVTIPLKVGRTPVGAMFVNYRRVHRFTHDELELMRLFAHQAAVAIRNAQMYEEIKLRARAMTASYEAGRAAAGSLNREDILATIAEQAWHLGALRTQGVGFAEVRLIEGASARLMAAFPRDRFGFLNDVLKEFNLAPADGQRVGIVGRACKTRHPQNVPDVTKDRDYFLLDGRTISELAVPILWRNNVIGVINVEHTERDAFTDVEVKALQSLADQASVTIEHIKSFEALKQAQSTIDLTAAAACHLTIVASWQHAIRQYIVALTDRVKLAQDDLVAGKSTQELMERLDSIASLAPVFLRPPITAKFSEDVESMLVGEFLNRTIEGLRESWSVDGVTIELSVAPDPVRIRINPGWLNQAVGYIISNAQRAMSATHEKTLTVLTRRVNGGIEIDFTDTGCGMPKELRDQIFTRIIPKPEGTEGSGAGLLIAWVIILAHRGRIEIAATSDEPPTGTTIRIWLPLEDEQHPGDDTQGERP